MQHGGQKSIGDLVSRHVCDRDPCLVTAGFQVPSDLLTPLFLRLTDPGIDIVSMVEVDVEDVVSANDPVQGHCFPEYIEPRQLRKLTREGFDIAGNLLKILEFAGKLPDRGLDVA